MTPGRTAVFVHLDHGRSPRRWAAAHAAGRVLEPSPYGYAYAGEYLALTYSTDHPESKATCVLRRSIAFVLGFDIVHAWRNRQEMGVADVVWTHTEHEHLAIALLKRLKLMPPVLLLGQSVWLWDEWARLARLRRGAYLWLLRAVDLHTTHSPQNAAIATRVLQQQAHFVPFGVEWPADARLDRPSGGHPFRVVAPGNDRHRDWATLVAAIEPAPDMRAVILSRRRKARQAARRSSRVEVTRATSIRALVDEYERANVVAVPLRDNSHVSGITVALEALTAGRGVAITRVGGLDSYLDGLVSWAHVGDNDSLGRAIEAAGAASADGALIARRRDAVVARGLTLRDYGLRHVLMTQYLIERSAMPSAVSELQPVQVNA